MPLKTCKLYINDQLKFEIFCNSLQGAKNNCKDYLINHDYLFKGSWKKVGSSPNYLMTSPDGSYRYQIRII